MRATRCQSCKKAGQLLANASLMAASGGLATRGSRVKLRQRKIIVLAMLLSPRVWTLAFGQHEDRSPTHGYAATREAAMAAFAKSWRRE